MRPALGQDVLIPRYADTPRMTTRKESKNRHNKYYFRQKIHEKKQTDLNASFQTPGGARNSNLGWLVNFGHWRYARPQMKGLSMLTVTLLCNPKTPVLEPALADALRNAWGGGDVIWLADGAACEFQINHRPDTFENTWAEMQNMQVDLNVLPSENRKKKILLADMDSTMIQQECIDELAAQAGVGAKVANITARAMNGELDFEAALRERVGLLSGLSVDVIDTVWSDRITMMPGGKTLLATMKANGAYAALVSGGFTEFTSRVAEKLGFDENRANTLLKSGGTLSGQVGMPILGQDAKVEALQDVTQMLGLSPKDVIAVGDGANDLGMLTLAGTGVALHAKPSVQEKADIRINHGDLTALLFLQGYAASEFE